MAVGPEAPAAARNAVGTGLAGRVAEDALRDARLLVSELVIKPSSDGGFGLHLVGALAHRWGVTREGFTRVWAELPAWPSAHGSGNADVRATR